MRESLLLIDLLMRKRLMIDLLMRNPLLRDLNRFFVLQKTGEGFTGSVAEFRNEFLKFSHYFLKLWNKRSV